MALIFVPTGDGTFIIKGLSTDTKPTTNVPAGSIFKETDTGRLWSFDGSIWQTTSVSNVFFKTTSPLNIIYSLSSITSSLGTTNDHTLNVLRAFPFYLSEPVTLDAIVSEVTAGGTAGSRYRIGIYRATSLFNPYPSALVAGSDAAEYNADAVAVTDQAVSILLVPGVYWSATFNNAAAAPTFRGNNAATTLDIMGYPRALGALATQRRGLTVAATYGAMPTPFPAGATELGVAGLSSPIFFHILA